MHVAWLGAITCITATGRCICSQPAGLLQQSADQLAGQSHPASAIRSECSSQAHLQHEAI